MTHLKRPGAYTALALAVAAVPSADAMANSGGGKAYAAQTSSTAISKQSAAERLKKLDIMLMVSSLRCRYGAHNFRASYEAFNAKHRLKLNAAHRELKSSLVARLGPARGKKALDRIDVSMANQYGQGHPWLNCQELGETTERLAHSQAKSELLSTADYVLGNGPSAGDRATLVASY